jgi:hypothetical protein
VAPSASIIAQVSAGNAAWSPVSSTNSAGTVTPGAHRTNPAFHVSPDHLDSQASGVVSQPKPTWPQLMRSRRFANCEP